MLSLIFPDCSALDCQSKAEYQCACEFPNPYVCKAHYGDHAADPHRPIEIFKSVSEFDRHNIVNSVLKCKQVCAEMSACVIKSLRSVIIEATEIANKTINIIREAEMLYEEILRAVNSTEKVRSIGDLTLVEKMISHQAGISETNAAYWNLPIIELKLKIVDENQLLICLST